MLATGVSPWNENRVEDPVPEGRYIVSACCAAPLGLEFPHESRSTGLRPWLALFRRSAAGLRTYGLAISLLVVLFACRSQKTNAGAVMKEFVEEFYSGRAQPNMTAVVAKYTEWPDFATGDSVQIAKAQDIRHREELKKGPVA